MAFENVFRGIDWDAQNRGARQDQALLMRSIGQGMAAYERGQERDMRQRQMDMRQQQLDYQMSQTKPTDYEQVAMDALAKQQMGVPLTPQDKAAISVMQQTTAPSTYIDPVSMQQVTRPSPWANVGIGGGAMQQPQQAAPMMRGQGSIPEVGAGRIPPVPAGAVGGLPMDMAGQPPLAPTIGDTFKPEYQRTELPPMLQNTPRGQLEQYQEDKTISKEDRAFQREKQKMQLQADFDEKKAQKKLQELKKAGRPAMLAEHAIMSDDIVQSLDILNSSKGVLPKTGTIGSILDFFPETEAGRLATKLESVKNLVGFGKLGQMRQNSPTGSSGLGSLSESEMEGLQKTSGNIEIKQRPDDLDYNLKRLFNQQQDTIHGTPEHIAKIGKEKGLPKSEIDSLSFRYDLRSTEQKRRARYEDLMKRAGR